MNHADLDVIEIRLLGPLRVRRADGSWIEPSEWRTRKTLELLRILALHEGKRVSTDVLVDALWRGSDLEHGNTSLRTAASLIRKVTRIDCIARSHGGLLLQHAWVDTQRFKALADECSRASAEGRHASAVAAARSAEALYVDDLIVSPESDATTTLAHEALRRARIQLLLDAATSAMALHWTHDAVTFAANALELDPSSERACRTAMLAFQSVGETTRALRVYQECQTRLVDELGVDPSPQTQAVYLQLLGNPSAPQLTPPFTGLEAETTRLASQLSAAAGDGGGCFVLAGPPRSGVSRWLNEAISQLPASLPVTNITPRPSDKGAPLVEGRTLRPGLNVIDEAAMSWPLPRLRGTVEFLRTAPDGACSVVVVTDRTGNDTEADSGLRELAEDGALHRIDMPTMSVDDLLTLTRSLVSGEPSPELAAELERTTGRYAGLVVDTVVSWLAQGRLHHTSDGVELGPDPDVADEQQADHEQLSELHATLTGEELTVLEALATVSSITILGLLTLLGHDEAPTDAARAEVGVVLSRLEEFALLAVDGGGRYLLRSRRLRDALASWTRPGRHRQLHRMAAERLTLPIADRVRHWTQAGETQLACAAAMEGAESEMNDGIFAPARQLLLQVRELLDDDTSTAKDRLGIVGRLAVCAEQLGLKREAAAYFAEAEQLGKVHGLEVPTFATHQPLEAPTPPPAPPVRSRPDYLEITPSTSPTTEVEALLNEAITAAELRGDLDEAAEARLLLVGYVLAPRRRFAEAHHVLNIAKSTSRLHRPMAEATEFEARVLLGDPAVALEGLPVGADGADTRCGLTSGLPVGILTAMAYHDRADEKAKKVLDEAIAGAERLQPGGPWRWVAARILVQRGEVDQASDLVEGCSWRVGSPTARILSLLGKAELSLAQGDRSGTANDLLRGVEVAQRTGATLLLPEVAACLVMVGDEEDLESTVEYLDLAEIALGESTVGRERITIMLARAACRAAVGRRLSAAVVAGGAADLAASLGFHYAAVHAAEQRALYLADAGMADATGVEPAITVDPLHANGRGSAAVVSIDRGRHSDHVITRPTTSDVGTAP